MKRTKQFLTSEAGYALIWLFCSALGITLQMLICRWYSINYDSSYQFALTGKSFPELWRLLQADYSPPLYAILLKLVSMLFGESITVYRLFNGLPLLGMLYLGLFPIQKEFGQRAGFLTAFLILITNINLYLFGDIRPTYYAYFFVAGAAVYGYLAFFKKKRSYMAALTVFAVLCVYTHNIAMITALGIYVVCLTGAILQKDRRHFLSFIVSGIICAVLYLPWLSILLHQVSNVNEHYWEGHSFSISLAKSWGYDKVFLFSDLNLLTTLIDMLPRIAIVLILFRYFKIDRKADMAKLKADCKEGFGKCRSHAVRYAFVIAEWLVPLLIFAVINECFHKLATQRYFYIFTGISLLLMALPIAKLKNRIISIVFCLLMLVNFSGSYISLLQKAENCEGKQMVEDIQQAHPDGNISFLHMHEWTIGIMMYFFPDADHYICDETWTVLTDLSVFPSEVIRIGDASEIINYTDQFYYFAQSFPDSEVSNFSELEDKIELISKNEYAYSIANTGTAPKAFVISEFQVSETPHS